MELLRHDCVYGERNLSSFCELKEIGVCHFIYEGGICQTLSNVDQHLVHVKVMGD